jgi:hypothetical protein
MSLTMRRKRESDELPRSQREECSNLPRLTLLREVLKAPAKEPLVAGAVGDKVP